MGRAIRVRNPALVIGATIVYTAFGALTSGPTYFGSNGRWWGAVSSGAAAAFWTLAVVSFDRFVVLRRDRSGSVFSDARVAHRSTKLMLIAYPWIISVLAVVIEVTLVAFAMDVHLPVENPDGFAVVARFAMSVFLGHFVGLGLSEALRRL